MYRIWKCLASFCGTTALLLALINAFLLPTHVLRATEFIHTNGPGLNVGQVHNIGAIAIPVRVIAIVVRAHCPNPLNSCSDCTTPGCCNNRYCSDSGGWACDCVWDGSNCNCPP